MLLTLVAYQYGHAVYPNLSLGISVTKLYTPTLAGQVRQMSLNPGVLSSKPTTCGFWI